MGKRKGQEVDGVLLLDKPEGGSSNFALQCARRKLEAKKAGHTGTLDPFATGLLVCCFGKATKICGAMLNADKSYRATLTLGSETDSGDLTGEAVQQLQTFTGITEEQLKAVIPQFVGDIEQIPPMYSALKRNGKPLYEYIRQGIELAREPRKVTIYEIAMVTFSAKEAVLDVFCSKGTYIRTLAQDIGRALGCFAHLRALRRTSVGPFKLSEAVTLEAFQALDDPRGALLSLNDLPPDLLPEKLRTKEIL